MALVTPDPWGPYPAEPGRAGEVIALDAAGQPQWAGLPLIPPIAELFPSTRRWRKVRPCGTAAAWRRHQRRREPQDERCLAWRRQYLRRWRKARKGR